MYMYFGPVYTVQVITILLPKKYLTRRKKSGITFEEVPERFTHNLRNNHNANIELSKQTNALPGPFVEIP
jgi:hypothetical protein